MLDLDDVQKLTASSSLEQPCTIYLYGDRIALLCSDLKVNLRFMI